jgi:hypothetical protein
MKRASIPTVMGAMLLLMPLGYTTIALAATPAAPAGPRIQTEDVYRFYKLYDATGGHPTADQLQHDYLDPGTGGLHNLAKVRNVTGARIADNIAKHPEMYSDARQCIAALPRVRQRVEVALRKLGRLYPEAQFPPVTIVVGLCSSSRRSMMTSIPPCSRGLDIASSSPTTNTPPTNIGRCAKS